MRAGLIGKVNNEMELFEVLKENANLFALNYELTLRYAEEIFEKYCVKMKRDDIENNDDDKNKQKSRKFSFSFKNFID